MTGTFAHHLPTAQTHAHGLPLPATQIAGCHLETMNSGAVTWKETESLMTVWGHHTALGCLRLSVSERKMLSFSFLCLFLCVTETIFQVLTIQS